MGGRVADTDGASRQGKGMTENQTRKLNVTNFVTLVLIFAAITLGAHLAGRIQFDLSGLLAFLAFFGFLIGIGYLADKSGVATYLGWDKPFK